MFYSSVGDSGGVGIVGLDGRGRFRDPISESVMHSMAPPLVLWKRPPDSASVAEDIKFFMMLLTVWMAPLGVGVIVGGCVGSTEHDFSIKCPPTRVRYWGLDP